MFFSISNHLKENYSKNYTLGKFHIGVDEGWKFIDICNKSVIYKGYADLDSLDNLIEQIAEQTEPIFTGSFCALVYCPILKEITIKTDTWRSIPLFVNKGHEVTNLIKHPDTIWCDAVATISESMDIKQVKFDPIGEIIDDRISEEEGLNIIDSILTEKTRSFLAHNTKPIKAFLSGGSDSLLVYSYLKKLTTNFEFVPGEHFEWDRFFMKNRENIQKYFFFTQFHHWLDDTILTSGSSGDEFNLRAPYTGSIYLMSTENGKTLRDFNTDPNNMHYTYFGKDKNMKIYQDLENQKYKNIYSSWSRSRLVSELCNNLVNDCQHWHLGRTIVWAPLRDLRITKTILRMPQETILGQMLNADISKKLIERNDPSLLRALDKQKNTQDYLSNLYEYLKKLKILD